MPALVEIARIDKTLFPHLFVGIGGIAVTVRIGIFFPLVHFHHAPQRRRMDADREEIVGERFVHRGEPAAHRDKLTRVLRWVAVRDNFNHCLFDFVGGTDIADIVALVPPEQDRSYQNHQDAADDAREQTAFFVAGIHT